MKTITVNKVCFSNHLVVARYRRYAITLNLQACLLAAVMVMLLVLLSGYALTVGKLPISLSEALEILWSIQQQEAGFKQHILLDIRLPRILTALLSGAALGISGAIFQSISRNPLGSPDIIGFTSGAASGALMQIILLGGGALQISISAIVGGIVTALLVLLLSYKAGRIERNKLILNGIGLGAIFTALNGLLLVIGNLDNAVTANFWLAGSLHARTWNHVLPLAVGLVISLSVIQLVFKPLLYSDLGDERAKSLGIEVEKVRLVMTLLAVVLAALATGATGPIAFIALAAPQLVNRLKNNAQLSLFNSGLMGALLLLFADLLTQVIPVSLNLPIGRVTGIVGGMYLLCLLSRMR
ncbi:FecCD family ABC transporter permease [Agarivorans sp. QJM3NY_25]|uniref:FecCD family ABC transporter permease n=1 Tax=Agarivorans sp. QJM3NY_25 TaxID=3421430 RepID=UPI003D7D4986